MAQSRQTGRPAEARSLDGAHRSRNADSMTPSAPLPTARSRPLLCPETARTEEHVSNITGRRGLSHAVSSPAGPLRCRTTGYVTYRAPYSTWHPAFEQLTSRVRADGTAPPPGGPPPGPGLYRTVRSPLVNPAPPPGLPAPWPCLVSTPRMYDNATRTKVAPPSAQCCDAALAFNNLVRAGAALHLSLPSPLPWRRRLSSSGLCSVMWCALAAPQHTGATRFLFNDVT
jgi:hypothetical protein